MFYNTCTMYLEMDFIPKPTELLVAQRGFYSARQLFILRMLSGAFELLMICGFG